MIFRKMLGFYVASFCIGMFFFFCMLLVMSVLTSSLFVEKSQALQNSSSNTITVKVQVVKDMDKNADALAIKASPASHGNTFPTFYVTERKKVNFHVTNDYAVPVVFEIISSHACAQRKSMYCEDALYQVPLLPKSQHILTAHFVTTQHPLFWRIIDKTGVVLDGNIAVAEDN